MKFSIIKSAAVLPDKEEEWTNEIPKPMKRRAPRIWRMAHVAVSRVLNNSEITPKSIIASTALGALDETANFLNGSFTDGFGSPRNFIASVHNSMAGNLAMSFGIKGPNLTVCDSQNSLASSIVSAGFLKKEDFPLLLVAVDERTDLLEKLHSSFTKECQEILPENWQEGAVAFIIDLEGKSECSISADGPMPLNDLPVNSLIDSLSEKFIIEGFRISDIYQSSNSFIASAIALHNCFDTDNKSNIVIPSYSPTSDAVSFIKVES